MREIGSSFFLREYIDHHCYQTIIPLKGLKAYSAYYSSCRDAIREVLNREKIQEGYALVPPFTCHAVLQPFLERKLKIKTYSINRDLSINVDKTLQKIGEDVPAVFIHHPYFGFDDPDSLRLFNVLKAKGVITVEDRTQNMFSDVNNNPCDYLVGSIRKWLEIPDGGFLSTDKNTIEKCTEEFDKLIEVAMSAMKDKYRFLYFGEGSDMSYRSAFASYEDMLDKNMHLYGISKETNNICYTYEWDKLKKSRQKNYEVLSEKLKDIKQIEFIRTCVESGTVPFMFPIYVKKERKPLQDYLAQNKIYATAIWGCSDELLNQIDEKEHRIYQEILCFAIDQRYDNHDMERIANCMKEYFKEN